ncbi:hypothetical protein [Vibrio sp.]|uniref:hypothetical protein n=1 Tax=Vibrio sp. TaxID=678 RepID=UPI003D142177
MLFEQPTIDRDNSNHSQQCTQLLFLLEQYNGKETFVSSIPLKNGQIGTPIVIDPQELIEKLTTQDNTVELIDDRILVKTASKLVWTYQPAATQPLYYRHNKHSFTKPIKWPKLIFKLENGRLAVCVAPNRKRPSLSDTVYHAPLPNVYESGNICLGSCSLPVTNNIDQIAETYLNSTKTHLNFSGALRAHKKLSQSQYFKWMKTKHTDRIKLSELAPIGSLNKFIQTA